jgi:hypothetical protein
MDEKTPSQPDASAPVSTPEKPAIAEAPPAEVTSPAKPVASNIPSTPPSPTTDATAKKASPIGKLLVILFILVDLALAGYILYRMMMPQG